MLTTSCLSNLKQISTASLLYAQDNDNTLPEGGLWAQQTQPYTKSERLYTCPALSKAGKQGGYAMDSRLSQAKTASIPNLPDTVLLFESTTESIGASDAQTSALTNPRHGDGIGVAFADAHVKSWKKTP